MVILENSELIKRIKASDIDAFKQLYNTKYSLAYHFAARYIPDEETIKDIIQESFAGFWENRHQLPHVNKINSFLYTIIKNKCLNYIQHQKVRADYAQQAFLSLKEFELQYSDKYNEVYAKLSYNDLRHKVDVILETLPEERRMIFEMSRFQGLKNAEIAKKLNLSVRTVDTQIYRAMKVFKEAFKNKL